MTSSARPVRRQFPRQRLLQLIICGAVATAAAAAVSPRFLQPEISGRGATEQLLPTPKLRQPATSDATRLALQALSGGLPASTTPVTAPTVDALFTPAPLANNAPAGETPGTGSVRPASDGATEESADGEETLFLTIIGDKTYASYGQPGAREPRTVPDEATVIDGQPLERNSRGFLSGGGLQFAVNNTPPRTADAGSNNSSSISPGPLGPSSNQSPNVVGQRAAGTRNPAPAMNGGEPSADPGLPTSLPDGNPMILDSSTQLADGREWPTSSCPWTLGSGATDATAAQMQAQYGCRYLSTCSVQTQECTYFYIPAT